MKLSKFAVFLVAATGTAAAENVEGVNELICSTGQAQICFESNECYAATPWELSVPDFVLVDVKKKTISTTEGSGDKRSTVASRVERADGLILMQGIEDGRAFSFVIHESTGRLTAAIARDGFSVAVFGACTDKDVD